MLIVIWKWEIRSYSTLKQSNRGGWADRRTEAVGRGTGKLAKEAGGSRASLLKETGQCRGENAPQKLRKHRHWNISLECRAEPPQCLCLEQPAARATGRFLKHVKIWCNSASHVEMHASESARCCKTDYSKRGFHALRAPLGISHPCKSWVSRGTEDSAGWPPPSHLVIPESQVENLAVSLAKAEMKRIAGSGRKEGRVSLRIQEHSYFKTH